jgi:N-methylhydantoinase A
MGGALSLDLAGAETALDRRIASPLGLSRDAAAAGVLAMVVARLAGAIKLSLFERGLDPRDFSLMSFGGAGGLHAIDVAQELGMREVVFPREPSTFSAHGILQSDIVHDLARTRIIPLDVAHLDQINSLAAELASEGDALLDGDRMPPERRILRLAADLRYRGQAFELMVPLDGPALTKAALADLAKRFHCLHHQRFSFDDRGEGVELVTLRLSAIGLLAAARPAATSVLEASAGKPAPKGHRRVHLDGGWHDVAVVDQLSLATGARVDGPAIIEQPYTTLIITGGWQVVVLASGDLLATRDAG